jgi:Tol biopolymer transport system component
VVTTDQNQKSDVFLYDVTKDTVSLVSRTPEGKSGNDASFSPSISADGRYVAFASVAKDLVPGMKQGSNTNASQIFLFDRETKQVTLVSAKSDGTPGNLSSVDPVISGNGKVIAYTSEAYNLAHFDQNLVADVLRYDISTGQTTLVSNRSDGTQSNGPSEEPSLSYDGRYVSYTSYGSNLVANDTNNAADVFLYDAQAGYPSTFPTLVSVQSNGSVFDAASRTSFISKDGFRVTFLTRFQDSGQNATGYQNVFLRDVQAGQTTRVSGTSSGGYPNGDSQMGVIAGAGGYIVFSSNSCDMGGAGAGSKHEGIYLYDVASGTIWQVSQAADGAAPDGDCTNPSISGDGSLIAFESTATNLAAEATTAVKRIFVAKKQ